MPRRPAGFLCALLGAALGLAAAAPAGGQPVPGPPTRVTDLRGAPIEGSSSPAELTAAGEWLYFRAVDPAHGAELWRTDGSANGARRVVDLCPGACSSDPRSLVALGDRLLFTAGPHDRPRLWVSDGSEAGTIPLAPVYRFASRRPFVDGELAFFTSDGPETGAEPWITDGTPEGTRLLADLCPGECDSGPRFGARIPAGLVFSVAPLGQPRLYRTDGTTAGTVKLADLCSERCLAPADGFLAAGGLVFFSAYDDAHGSELWVTDGTTAGTRMVVDLVPGGHGSSPEPVAAFGGELYFHTTAGSGWWRTDGTAAGTVPASELVPAGSPPGPLYELTVAAGRLYFGIRTGPGNELWALDGLGQRPRLIRRGLGSLFLFSTPEPPGPLRDLFFFRATDEDSRYEPWVTDGTPEGTRRLARVDISIGGFAPAGDRMVFAARDPELGDELWASDGTPRGTGLLEDLVPADSSSSPRELVQHEGALFFVAEHEHGTGLWRYRPGRGPAELAAAVDPEATLSARGGLLFVRGGSGRGHGLEVYDPGSPSGLVGLVDFLVEAELVAAGGRVLFATPGPGLWTTDGSPQGTEPVRAWSEYCDSGAGLPVIPRIALVPAGGAAYFLIQTDECELELWRSDGTTEGTVRVAPPDPELDLLSLSPLGDRGLVVQGSLGQFEALWVLDARRNRTSGFFVLGLLGWTRFLPPAGELAYFVELEHDGRYRLWRTDGTAGGTFALADVGRMEAAGSTDPGRWDAASAEGLLFFTSRSEEHGEELWVSDGTLAGTRRVVDLHPGPRGSLPRALTPAGAGIAFAADDGTSGHEPWWSDGTADGTLRLADLAPGRDASSPSRFAALGDVVYFDADNGESGRELWAVELLEDTTVPPDATQVEAPELPGFRLWVRITAGGAVQPTRREPGCIPETVCVSGAVPGRSELFVRIVGPKPNGRLWPTLVRFSTSRIDVWIEQTSSGEVRHYRLEAATPGDSSLNGQFDRDGFVP